MVLIVSLNFSMLTLLVLILYNGDSLIWFVVSVLTAVDSDIVAIIKAARMIPIIIFLFIFITLLDVSCATNICCGSCASAGC